MIADKFSRRMASKSLVSDSHSDECPELTSSPVIAPHSHVRAVFVGAIIFLLGGILQTAAANREMMLAGRFFAGLSIGMLVSPTS